MQLALLLGLLGLLPGAASAAGPEAGRVNFVKEADSSFDSYTAAPPAERAAWMRRHYFRQKTYSPYFDSRLSWFPNAWAYQDLYAVYADERGGGLADRHPDWLLRSPQGQRLFIPWGCGGGWCPQYAADVGNPAFRRHWIDEAKRTLRQGYRGLFIDDVNMLFRVSDGWGNQVAPHDPRTGRTMTEADWRRYVAEFSEQIGRELRSELPGIEIAHNALWWLDKDPYVERQLLAADYFNVERGVSDTGIRGGSDRYGLETLLGHLDWLHARGRHAVLDAYARDADSAEYNLAVYFLASEGRDAVRTDFRNLPDNWWPGYDVDLGPPRGPRYTWNGLLRRDFEHGHVLVNQPDRAPQWVDLPDAARGPDGGPRAAAALPPGGGRVVVTRTAPPSSGGGGAAGLEEKARGRPTAASSSEHGSLGSALAVDADGGTRWSSAFADGQWWQVELGRTRSVSRVELDWERAFAARYRILTSTDGRSFAEAASAAASGAGTVATSFSPRGARYVRVELLERGTPWGISFWEARVLGPDD